MYTKTDPIADPAAAGQNLDRITRSAVIRSMERLRTRIDEAVRLHKGLRLRSTDLAVVSVALKRLFEEPAVKAEAALPWECVFLFEMSGDFGTAREAFVFKSDAEHHADYIALNMWSGTKAPKKQSPAGYEAALTAMKKVGVDITMTITEVDLHNGAMKYPE